MEMARDEVRVMTVHGAKGLEAKNVILVDSTTTRPEGAHPPRLLTAPSPARRRHATAPDLGVAKDKDAGPMADARARGIDEARDEYRRLLYVGMTRAAERLVVCGTKGVNKIRKAAGTSSCSSAQAAIRRERRRRRQGLALPQMRAPRRRQRRAARATKTTLPAWLARDAAGRLRRRANITPSSAKRR